VPREIPRCLGIPATLPQRRGSWCLPPSVRRAPCRNFLIDSFICKHVAFAPPTSRSLQTARCDAAFRLANAKPKVYCASSARTVQASSLTLRSCSRLCSPLVRHLATLLRLRGLIRALPVSQKSPVPIPLPVPNLCVPFSLPNLDAFSPMSSTKLPVAIPCLSPRLHVLHPCAPYLHRYRLQSPRRDCRLSSSSCYCHPYHLHRSPSFSPLLVISASRLSVVPSSLH
jgi:hypothetical protein